MEILRGFWNSPIGPKTTHFWGPVFNWSIPIAVCQIDESSCWKSKHNSPLLHDISLILIITITQSVFLYQALLDTKKPPEMISGNMTAGLQKCLISKHDYLLFFCSFPCWITELQLLIGILQSCAVILHCSWGLHGWYSHVTSIFSYVMPRTRLCSCISSLVGSRLKSK